MRDGNVNTAMCTWRLTPLSLYLHTAARHFLKSLLLNPSSIHRKKTQNSISFTKARPIHKGWIPNVIYPQYRTSRWNRSSRKPSPENPFCVLYEGFDIKCHLWTWRTRTIVQALAHSLSPSLSPSDCQTHRENSLLLWRFQYFQNCSTDAAEVLYQEFWSVWLFTSRGPTNRVLSGLRSKLRLSITFLRNSLRTSSPSFNTSKMMKYYSNPDNNTVSIFKTTKNSDERWLFPPHVCWNSQLLGFLWRLIQHKTWCTLNPGHY